jgi:ribosomal protein S18 acetylase RimI-like enzyme
MEIRRAAPPDYPAFLALIQELDAAHAAGAPRHFRVPEPPGRTQLSFMSQLANPRYALFVAPSGSKILGMVQLRLDEASSLAFLQPLKVVTLFDWVVHPDCRRQGLGQALLEQAKRWARAQGADELSLSVAAFNQGAKAAVEAAGFLPLMNVLHLPLDTK